uniref:G_PROTEIN_RECEP_F1_2 domain-containing protein n=1 Tax=Toxocara canis TaxID=6265 RepID=A0A183TZP3_TOXCA
LAVSILALAFWDTILLWCAFFYYGMSALTRAHNSDTTTLLTPWFHGFSQIANTASIWCVVAITVQRFMASRDPFRCSRSSRTLLSSFRGERRSSSLSMIYCSTNRRHFRMPILLSFAAILLNIPAFFEIESHLCRRKEGRYGYGVSAIHLHYDLLFSKLLINELINSFMSKDVIRINLKNVKKVKR